MDYDYKRSVMYWTDNVENIVYRGSLKENVDANNNYQDITRGHTYTKLTGIAFDALGK